MRGKLQVCVGFDSSEPEDLEITRSRLKLVEAAKTALARCLSLMSMEAPERM